MYNNKLRNNVRFALIDVVDYLNRVQLEKLYDTINKIN